MVSPPCGEKEREEKREKGGRKGRKKTLHAYSAFSSSTDTPIRHITQTVTASSCKNTPSWKWKLKVVSVQLTDTQTHSVHEGTLCLSGGAIDNSDRADMSCLSTHSRDMTRPRIALKPGEGKGVLLRLYLFMYKWPFLRGAGRARPPAVADSYGSFSRARVLADTKERGSPWAMLCTGAAFARWPETVAW